MDGPGSALVPSFSEKYGMWRTDYLVEGDLEGRNNIKVCEINARITFNGIWLVGSHGAAYKHHICKGDTGSFENPDDFEVCRPVNGFQLQADDFFSQKPKRSSTATSTKPSPCFTFTINGLEWILSVS
jgi:hypothetical protein